MLAFAAIALAVLAAPTLGLAGSQSPSALRAQNAQLEARSRSAVLQLYSLDQQLVLAHARVASLDREATSLQAERAGLAQQVRVARRGDRIAQRQLALRLRMLYEQGDVEPLEILLGAQNLDDAINSIDSLSSMAAQGEDVLQQLAAARRVLAHAQASLAERQAAIAAAESAARATEASLATTRIEREAYVSSLTTQRRLNDRQIAAAVARAQAAQARTAAIARAEGVDSRVTASDVPAPAPAPPAAPAAPATPATPAAPAANTLTVTATGYSLPGSTSTGLPVGWGVAAVDPSVIPLGTHMVVPGYGVAVAADTGSGIVGATIDLWFPTVAQANAWGRRTVTVQLQ
jgi:3D (Asp-Asp-Asp) domain-containing protein/septal ring factor EnvC (AmiA/AmiB activator)